MALSVKLLSTSALQFTISTLDFNKFKMAMKKFLVEKMKKKLSTMELWNYKLVLDDIVQNCIFT